MVSRRRIKVHQVDLTQKLRKNLKNSKQFHHRDIHLFEKLSKLEKILGIKAKNYVPESRDISKKVSTAQQIPIFEPLLLRHQFSKYIRSPNHISSKDLYEILEKISFPVYLYESGAVPAAFNPATDYTEHSWTRDTAIVAYAMGISNHLKESRKAIQSLAVFYGRKEQRDRFISFHYHHDPYSKYRFGHPTNELPHIRARIDETGKMVESLQDWSHSQLDAIGMWLFTTFKLANLEIINLSEVDTFLNEEVNGDNKLESIFSVGLKFLNRINFWHQHDHGPWEDRLEPSRASSVGIGIAALNEALLFFNKYGPDAIKIYKADADKTLIDEINLALKEAKKVLEFRLPLNGAYAVETEAFQADSALSFLLFPFNPGLNVRQENAIIKTLYEKRMGPVGFSRRDNDEYLGHDYIYNVENPCFCDPSIPFYRPAQWTMFDPLLAAFYYQRFLDSNAMDMESFTYADRHLRRTLLMVTKSKDSFRKAFSGMTVKTPKGRIPEAYFYDSILDKWRPNENTPLLMAEAAFAFMIDRAEQACKLWNMSQDDTN
jgi:hypothetical protein